MTYCKEHDISTYDESDATYQARYYLTTFANCPDIVAEMITRLADRQDGSCRVALHNRYMLSNAFREALLPNGWFEPVAMSHDFVTGPRTLLDTTPYDLSGPAFARWLEENYELDFPSEDQVISWNIHNDHADGADFDDV